MAAKSDSKFGTFGGVYTPSLLTILGVIMYLRLPKVVGEAGLGTAIGIILAAHVVSVCTGLSISSIATDRNVGAGGPYYIVSRSLGLPIGGTLGIALFLGLSFSISLYVIGFSESFLATIGVPISPTAIRVCGTVTVVLITIITFISTSLAIKTQYIILALIALSLLAIFFGSPATPATEVMWAAPEGSNPAELFGIFFPAVTGFTAGVNMSGDLRNPKKALPLGTMAAILTGMAVYLSLAIYLAVRVRPEELVSNPRVLEDLAVWGPAVTAGIWGATLSSALGSILGAPRILQTISGDGITPRWFARGYGKTNEPRNALVLAFLIGWLGIMVAELDAIARVVSMVFMATYGFLNSAAAIEALVSPDFRPEFRIPKTISVVGAAASVLLMIQMDIVAMAAAVVCMAGLYVYLQRRQLRLESGDAWEGIWSTLVRAGLHRLAQGDRQHRNWRPNILMFRPDDGAPREALRRTASWLITGNGMLTDVRLRAPDAPAPKVDLDAPEVGPVVGVFDRTLISPDPYDAIEEFASHHGYSGVEPNTVLLDWDASQSEPRRLGALIDALRARDLNALLFSDATHEPPPGTPPRIDVWWRSDSTPALGISLIRFITSSPKHRSSAIRFLTVTRDSAIGDGLKNAARRLLEEARVTADVEVLLDTVEPKPLEQHVIERSKDAILAIVELPPPPVADHVGELSDVTAAVPSVLFMLPSSTFASIGRVVRAPVARPRDESEDEERAPLEVAELELPEMPEVAIAARALSERLERGLDDVHAQALTRVAARNVELVERVEAIVEKHFGMLATGLGAGNPVKQRRHVNRVQSSFLMDSGKLIEELVATDLVDQRDILEGRLRALVEDASLVEPEEVVTVSRDRKDFAPSPDDPREVAKLKQSLLSAAKSQLVTYDVHTGPLQRYYVERRATEVMHDVLRSFVTECWSLTVQLIKVFNSSRTSLTLIHGEQAHASADALKAFVESEKAQAIESLEALARAHEERVRELRVELASEARVLSQAYADDLARVDVAHLADSERKLRRDQEAQREELVHEALELYEYQKALFERAKLGLDVSAFQHRLATIVQRARESITIDLKNGVLDGALDLKKTLGAFVGEEAFDQPLKLTVDLSHRFDPQQAVDALVREGQKSTAELPESINTLSDESIQRLADGRSDEVEMVDLPLRRLAQFLLDAELVGPLTQLLSEIPAQEQRVVGVAEDVVRLIGFHQSEYDEHEAQTTFHAHMQPVVANGLERIEREVAPLEEIVPAVGELLETRLAAVLRGTDVYELTSSAQALSQHIRRRQGQRAVSGAQSLALRGIGRVREALVSAVYGRSAGVLMAKRLRDQTESAGALVDRVLGFVDENSPDPSVLEDLPFYYRQLFFGKNTFNETFWVEREDELARARRGIAQHARGGRGVLVVTGEPDSGKSALCRRLTSRALSGREIHWVSPPEEGRADPELFRRKLAETTGLNGTASEILAAIPERSVLVIEDLELWWERAEGGNQVVEQLLSLIEEHSGRVLILIEVGSLPFDMINRFSPLADHALAVVECGPLPAESLKEIVMLRHASTGITFELDGVPEGELSDWRLARLFSQHFSNSRGLVGTALTAWITHVKEADTRNITISTPARRGWEVLDRLRPGWMAVLVQLLLHKRMSKERLLRVSALGERELDHQLDALRRMGLIREDRKGIMRVDRFVTHALTERLRARKVIP